MSINEIMAELKRRFGDQYDVRFVPSVIIGGGHICRVTISNLPKFREFSATHPYSYSLALYDAYTEVVAEINRRSLSRSSSDA